MKTSFPDYKLWTADFIFIILANFTTYMGFYMLLPTLPIYITRMSGSSALAGLSMGVLLVPAIFIRPFAGKWLDTKGRKGVYFIGLLIFLLTALAFNFVHSLWALLFFRFLQGFGWGGTNTAAGTIAADVIPKLRLAEGMGYFALSWSLAMGIAPALALWLLDAYDFNALFAVVTGMLLLSTIFASRIRYHNYHQEPSAAKPVFIEKTALKPSLVAAFVAFGYCAVLSFLAMYGQSLDIPNVGLFFTAYALCILLSRPLFGPIADKKGYNVILIPGLIAMTLTMFLLWQAQTLLVFILAGALCGTAFGAIQPTLQAMSIHLVPPQRRGSATGTYMGLFDVGFGLGSVWWGWVASFLGYSQMFLLTSVPILIALFIYLRFAARPAGSSPNAPSEPS